ncbi:MAG: hypothetical protein FWF92_08095 [Oscillospiraceae bacterium]|nr:hypothetical protein [Oscillospiraceae bacterium]
MKKFIAILLAFILTAIPVTAFAHSDNTNAGSIPKTATAPVIDGVKDDIYDQGLFVPVRNPHNATPDGGLGGGADAWFLWDDDDLYIFMKIDLVSFYSPDDYEDLQTDEPWALTTCEILMDWSNGSDDAEQVCQVRMNDRGFPNVTLARSDPHKNGEECRPYIDWGFTKTDNSYCAEFKIKMGEFRKAVEALDVNFGSDFTAGKQIGLYIFSQENNESGDAALFVSVPTDMSGNWVPGNYDYVVLGDNVVGAVAEPEPEVPADEPAPVNEPVAAPPPVTAAPTGDAGIIILLAVMITAAAGIVIFKRKKAVR